MDRRIHVVVRILTKLIFQPSANNFGAIHDDGKRKRDRKLLEDVAKAVNLSPYYLSRLFKAKMKMTLKQYVDKLIMERAVEMAKDGRLTIYQIVDEVGGGDERNFRRRLKKTHGLTLSQFRKFCDEQLEDESRQKEAGQK